ncbi:hypothetical protein [Vibrio algarum]|uniref:Gfo/Idh/MocA-like oxidoreductase N-terminal domain-containing protein n=1 Tax=Vibrio algarum TaxID=3020714 RepID=A0ABT4YVA5_9VIBR|nr:hypothetical protein [Vibrio sp. KJ40-1]MDB1125514.1 hypothetical protein [Vibrio sp. KJ40-1]
MAMINKHILIFGGLGNPEHSVIKLYRELLIELYSHYSLIAIDPIKNHNKAREELYSQTNINYHHSYPNLNNYLDNQGKHEISAVFILTPVIYHLDILNQIQPFIPNNDCLVIIEKPSFSIDEIDEGFNQTVQKMKEQDNRFYFIDTAMVTPPLMDFSTNIEIPHEELPKKIIALGVDNPLNPHPLISEFSFCNKIASYNQRQLLNLATSGGAGFGLDMGIHAIAGFMTLIEKLPITVTNITIDNVFLEALTYPDLKRDNNAETYMLCSGNVTSASNDIAFIIEGGKGTDTWDRRLELYYENCVIVLGFGTLKYSPYFCSISDTKVIRREYKVAQSGYVQHFIDIRNLLGISNEAALISSDLSEKIMRNSMVLLRDIYQLTSNPITQDKNITLVETHKNQLLNSHETKIRTRLNKMLEDSLLNH